MNSRKASSVAVAVVFLLAADTFGGHLVFSADVSSWNGIEAIGICDDGKMTAVAREWSFPLNGPFSQSTREQHDIELWSASPWHRLLVLNAVNACTDLSFSADGRVLAACEDRVVELWNVPGGSLIKTFRVPTKLGAAVTVSVSPGGSRVLAGTIPDGCYLWDVAGNAAPTKIEGRAACFLQNGKRILVAEGATHTLRILDSSSLAEKQKFETASKTEERITRIVICRDETACATIAKNGYNNATIWDIARGQVVSKLIGHKSGINCVSLSYNGGLAATGASDHMVKVWKAATGKELATLKYPKFVHAVSFLPDGKHIVIGGSEALGQPTQLVPVWIWDFNDNRVTVLGSTNVERTMTANTAPP